MAEPIDTDQGQTDAALKCILSYLDTDTCQLVRSVCRPWRRCANRSVRTVLLDVPGGRNNTVNLGRAFPNADGAVLHVLRAEQSTAVAQLSRIACFHEHQPELAARMQTLKFTMPTAMASVEELYNILQQLMARYSHAACQMHPSVPKRCTVSASSTNMLHHSNVTPPHAMSVCTGDVA
jgi:hypothetical protein